MQPLTGLAGGTSVMSLFHNVIPKLRGSFIASCIIFLYCLAVWFMAWVEWTGKHWTTIYAWMVIAWTLFGMFTCFAGLYNRLIAHGVTNPLLNSVPEFRDHKGPDTLYADRQFANLHVFTLMGALVSGSLALYITLIYKNNSGVALAAFNDPSNGSLDQFTVIGKLWGQGMTFFLAACIPVFSAFINAFYDFEVAPHMRSYVVVPGLPGIPGVI